MSNCPLVPQDEYLRFVQALSEDFGIYPGVQVSRRRFMSVLQNHMRAAAAWKAWRRGQGLGRPPLAAAAAGGGGGVGVVPPGGAPVGFSVSLAGVVGTEAAHDRVLKWAKHSPLEEEDGMGAEGEEDVFLDAEEGGGGSDGDGGVIFGRSGFLRAPGSRTSGGQGKEDAEGKHRHSSRQQQKQQQQYTGQGAKQVCSLAELADRLVVRRAASIVGVGPDPLNGTHLPAVAAAGGGDQGGTIGAPSAMGVTSAATVRHQAGAGATQPRVWSDTADGRNASVFEENPQEQRHLGSLTLLGDQGVTAKSISGDTSSSVDLDTAFPAACVPGKPNSSCALHYIREEAEEVLSGNAASAVYATTVSTSGSYSGAVSSGGSGGGGGGRASRFSSRAAIQSKLQQQQHRQESAHSSSGASGSDVIVKTVSDSIGGGFGRKILSPTSPAPPSGGGSMPVLYVGEVPSTGGSTITAGSEVWSHRSVSRRESGLRPRRGRLAWYAARMKRLGEDLSALVPWQLTIWSKPPSARLGPCGGKQLPSVARQVRK
jgi:hypothetical protein